MSSHFFEEDLKGNIREIKEPEGRYVDYQVLAVAQRKPSGKYDVTFLDFPKASVVDAPNLKIAKDFAKECVGNFLNDIVKAKQPLPSPTDEKLFKKTYKFSQGYHRFYVNVRLIEQTKNEKA